MSNQRRCARPIPGRLVFLFVGGERSSTLNSESESEFAFFCEVCVVNGEPHSCQRDIGKETVHTLLADTAYM